MNTQSNVQLLDRIEHGRRLMVARAGARDLQHQEVIALSQALDELVNEYYRQS